MLNQVYTIEFFDGEIITVSNMKQYIEENWKFFYKYGFVFNKVDIPALDWKNLYRYEHKTAKGDYYIAADCLAIIYTGTGKIVPPLELLQYYCNQYGDKRLVKRSRRQYTNPRCVWGRRLYSRAKQIMRQWIYNPIDDYEPTIRQSERMRDAFVTILGYDADYRSVERGWKYQTKNRKQWMKNVSRNRSN